MRNFGFIYENYWKRVTARLCTYIHMTLVYSIVSVLIVAQRHEWKAVFIPDYTASCTSISKHS